MNKFHPKPKTTAKPKRRDQGASHSRVSFRDQLGSYVSHHRHIGRESLQRLLKTPVPTVMTWLVIGIALALPSALFVTLANVESMARGWDGAAQISLYLHKRVSETESRQLARELAEREGVSAVDYISPTQALAEFRQLSGYGDVLAHIAANPLPAVIVIKPVSGQSSDDSQLLFQQLKALPQVEQAVLDLEWVKRLYAMMALITRITIALAVLLSLGVLLVIGNTIRLAIESRRDEIVIVKLVGATNAFVRRPFLYTGVWYGLGGGVIAWLIINVSLLMLAAPVANLAGLYQSHFQLQGLGITATLLLWLVAMLLGLLGAWLAVGRHLGAIEPR